jgi:glutaredoxin
MRRKDKELIERNNEIVSMVKYVLPVLIALIIFLGIKLSKSTYHMTEIKLDKYISIVEGSKDKLVFVTNSNCDSCTTTKELLEKMFQGSNIKTYLITLENMEEEEKQKLMNATEETKESIIAPALLVVGNNKVSYSFDGPFDEDEIIKFLQDASLLRKVETETNE